MVKTDYAANQPVHIHAGKYAGKYGTFQSPAGKGKTMCNVKIGHYVKTIWFTSIEPIKPQQETDDEIASLTTRLEEMTIKVALLEDREAELEGCK